MFIKTTNRAIENALKGFERVKRQLENVCNSCQAQTVKCNAEITKQTVLRNQVAEVQHRAARILERLEDLTS